MKKMITLFAILFCITNYTFATVYSINTPVGFTFYAKAIMITDMEMSMGEKSKTMHSVGTYYYHVTSKKINDKKEIEYGLTIDTLIIEAAEGDEKHYAHSGKPDTYKEDEKLADAMQSLGKEFIFNVNAQGKLIKKEDQEVPSIAEFCFIEFSAKSINEKESWNVVQIDKSMGMENKTENTYTLDKIDNNDMHIAALSKNKLFGKDPIKSSYICDTKTGLLKQYDFTATSNLFGKMTMRIIYEAKW